MTRKIARVFPRRTNASPDDDLAYFGPPDLFAEADEVHVSVTFSWDIPRAEWLAKQWEPVAPVKMGGPALGTVGGNFTPGLYLKRGHVITSRGCPNACWFCEVWKRDGDVRELPIWDGWIVQDDNLLACSARHICAVFEMLARQTHPIDFRGGLEARRLTQWHAELLAGLRLGQMFFAYDTPNDLVPLIEAGDTLAAVGIAKRSTPMRCYLLCGYPGDTIDAAEVRARDAWLAGFMPFAMLWRDKNNNDQPREWLRWQRAYSRPAITRGLLIKATGVR